MPLLDVSDVLSDPDFATVFDVVRTTTAVSGGRTVLQSQTTANVIGVVQPASTRELERLPEAERTRGAITIYTTFALNAGSAGFTADTVNWNGSSYTVMSVDDWSQFGAGYVKALAQKQSIP